MSLHGHENFKRPNRQQNDIKTTTRHISLQIGYCSRFDTLANSRLAAEDVMCLMCLVTLQCGIIVKVDSMYYDVLIMKRNEQKLVDDDLKIKLEVLRQEKGYSCCDNC